MISSLANLYGSLLVVRPPVPATLNKAGANYKSEIAHKTYTPRGAYDEWLAICEGILEFGGDAIFDFEPEDDAFLDKGDLEVDERGEVKRAGTSAVLAKMDEVQTGRVFAANGPWVIVEAKSMRALLPNMLAHRSNELAYYRRLLARVASEGGYDLHVAENPHRWEGMADVAAVVDRANDFGKVVFTYTVSGHYDAGVGPKTMRSSRAGVELAADFAKIPPSDRIFAELVYPHFHGDTVHFGARRPDGSARLVHFEGGLYGDGAALVRAGLGDRIVKIGKEDAVENYAGNSRQVNDGVLVPDIVSDAFVRSIEELGLGTRKVALFELFGKAGGGPACATLYLPKNLDIPKTSTLRYSVRRDEARARRERIPESLHVDPKFFEGKTRG